MQEREERERMRRITLSSQSVFPRTQSILSSSSCSKPLKSQQFRLSSRFDDQTSKLSCRNPSLFLFRYAKHKGVNTYKEFRFLNCNACKATKSTNYVDNGVLDELPSKRNL
ncbi:ATP phosphoribosyltransferase [Actinidia chinensis var. chinensis]|uniref:ATP phosphoribosyltransferase n=1 Tax=Actinidia chinensis var. chinensis TaxID=1590841 RepID=A0A2R6Q8I5_ACTCC|nr:ATP phosphoribosyltransferase [Actinidia chinensis var. chinensis]